MKRRRDLLRSFPSGGYGSKWAYFSFFLFKYCICIWTRLQECCRSKLIILGITVAFSTWTPCSWPNTATTLEYCLCETDHNYTCRWFDLYNFFHVLEIYEVRKIILMWNVRDLLLFFPICFCLFVFSPKLVRKPEKVCWVEAAGTVRDGVRAYTALHYLSQVSPGKTVLVMDGASVGNNCAMIAILEQKDYHCHK